MAEGRLGEGAMADVYRARDPDIGRTVAAVPGRVTCAVASGTNGLIRDGVSGEILGRSTFTANGAEPDATAPGSVATKSASKTQK